MKLLVFFTHDFWMRPHQENLPAPAPDPGEIAAAGAVVALVHAEPRDEGREGKVVTKAIKNLKWIAGKFDSRRVVLHYFAHLGSDVASPELARALVTRMGERLEGAEYEVTVTPFGWFTEFKLHVAGESLGKVFVDI